MGRHARTGMAAAGLVLGLASSAMAVPPPPILPAAAVPVVPPALPAAAPADPVPAADPAAAPDDAAVQQTFADNQRDARAIATWLDGRLRQVASALQALGREAPSSLAQGNLVLRTPDAGDLPVTWISRRAGHLDANPPGRAHLTSDQFDQARSRGIFTAIERRGAADGTLTLALPTADRDVLVVSVPVADLVAPLRVGTAGRRVVVLDASGHPLSGANLVPADAELLPGLVADAPQTMVTASSVLSLEHLSAADLVLALGLPTALSGNAPALSLPDLGTVVPSWLPAGTAPQAAPLRPAVVPSARTVEAPAAPGALSALGRVLELLVMGAGALLLVPVLGAARRRLQAAPARRTPHVAARPFPASASVPGAPAGIGWVRDWEAELGRLEGELREHARLASDVEGLKFHAQQSLVEQTELRAQVERALGTWRDERAQLAAEVRQDLDSTLERELAALRGAHDALASRLEERVDNRLDEALLDFRMANKDTERERTATIDRLRHEVAAGAARGEALLAELHRLEADVKQRVEGVRAEVGQELAAQVGLIAEEGERWQQLLADEAGRLEDRLEQRAAGLQAQLRQEADERRRLERQVQQVVAVLGNMHRPHLRRSGNAQVSG